MRCGAKLPNRSRELRCRERALRWRNVPNKTRQKSCHNAKPRWADAQLERERGQSLLAELRLVENDAATASRDLQRQDAQLAEIDMAHRERAPMLHDVSALDSLRDALLQQDALAGAESQRQTLLETLAQHHGRRGAPH